MNNRGKLTDEEVWTIFSNYQDVEQMVKYIVARSQNYFSNKDAMHIAVQLINEGFTLNDVLQGKANEKIDFIYNVEVSTLESILKEQEERKYIPVKKAKPKTAPFTLKKVLAGAVAFASLAVIYTTNIKEKETSMDISESFGKLTSASDEDFLHKRNIVAQNTYVHTDAKGNTIKYYNAYGIASDILSIDYKDMELFDLCLFDVYYNMDSNKLENMDDVFFNLKIQTDEDVDKVAISEQLEGYPTYLEYVLSRGIKYGLIKENTFIYDEYNNAIQNYRLKKLESDGVIFNSLNSSDQKLIEDLTDIGNKLRISLGKEHLSELNDMVKEVEMNKEIGGLTL